jgi:hypothetical protein
MHHAGAAISQATPASAGPGRPALFASGRTSHALGTPLAAAIRRSATVPAQQRQGRRRLDLARRSSSLSNHQDDNRIDLYLMSIDGLRKW